MGEIFAQSYLKYGFLGCVVRMQIEIIADQVLMLDEKGSWRAEVQNSIAVFQLNFSNEFGFCASIARPNAKL